MNRIPACRDLNAKPPCLSLIAILSERILSEKVWKGMFFCKLFLVFGLRQTGSPLWGGEEKKTHEISPGTPLTRVEQNLRMVASDPWT